MKEIISDVFYCGVHDRDRKIFDQLVPLPQGTTYNSYLVKGSQKVALIDTMYIKFADEYLKLFDGEKIDYIISNHAEPDHSGTIPQLLKLYPNAMVYCSQACSQNLQNMLGVNQQRIKVVKDGEILSLGNKTLQFYMTPWVHWPDTMMTHLVEDNLLFTCDLFGSHYTQHEVFAEPSDGLADAVKRYYSEIMLPYAKFCAKYLIKVEKIAPVMILPSHGPVYKGDGVAFIENLYRTWTGNSTAKKVIIGYVSMYNNVTQMADYLEKALLENGVDVIKADLMDIDEGEVAMQLIDAGAIIFGTGMVLTGPHPKAVYVAYLANILRPNLKYRAVIGSFGWGGNLEAPIDAMFTLTKPEKLPAVIAKGKPSTNDFAKLDELAKFFAENL